jgi:CTP synthase
MLGSQFHPEFKSRPNKPHPLFLAFVKAAIGQRERALDRTVQQPAIE